MRKNLTILAISLAITLTQIGSALEKPQVPNLPPQIAGLNGTTLRVLTSACKTFNAASGVSCQDPKVSDYNVAVFEERDSYLVSFVNVLKTKHGCQGCGVMVRVYKNSFKAKREFIQ